MFTNTDGIPVSGIHFSRISVQGQSFDLPVYALIDFGSPLHSTMPHFLKILNAGEANALNAQMNEILITDKTTKKP